MYVWKLTPSFERSPQAEGSLGKAEWMGCTEKKSEHQICVGLWARNCMYFKNKFIYHVFKLDIISQVWKLLHQNLNYVPNSYHNEERSIRSWDHNIM